MTVTEKTDEAASVGLFTRFRCEELAYFIRISKDKFQLQRFLSAAGHKERSPAGWSEVVCSSREPKTDYHVHARWRLEDEDCRFRITFYAGSKEPDPNEREPYAEEFMHWVAQFFANDNVAAHIHCEFKFRSTTRQSRFPLPITVPVGPSEARAEIDGISMKLPSKPEGVDKVWITQRKEELFVQLTADRRLTFKTFTPEEDLRALSAALDTVLEEKRL